MHEEAVESYHRAVAYFHHLTQTVDSLTDEEQTAIGKSIFYSTASLLGEFEKEGPKGGKVAMMPGEIREQVGGWSAEKRAELEKKVKQFRESDQASAMLAVATGAAEWALERWVQLDQAEKKGGEVNESKTRAGIIHLCGTGYATETSKFADAVNQMIREGHSDLAQNVIDATVNA